MHPDSLNAGDRRDELIALVALIRTKSRPVKVDRLAELVDHAGSAVELVQLKLEDVLFSTPEADYGMAGIVSEQELDEAAATVDEWIDRRLDVRTVLDANYPYNLHSIFDRPPLLFVKGEFDQSVDSRSVAIVGTRKASDAGLARARRLAGEITGAGFTVVSGLAAGVDTAAHTATLDAGGRTVAVMGTGIDHRYPAENRGLADRILESGGALLTQFFPHQTPRRWMFPMRNVVMSGLSLATIVVEASETSGAKIQARVALQHGRAVFLLRSLVQSHEWARKYVEEGAYGSKAIEVGTTEEVVERLDGKVETQAELTA